MSLFRTLQNQPRVISLFTQGLESNPSSKILYNELNRHISNDDPKKNIKIEVHKTFPTLDQLKYMNGINPKALEAQIPNLFKVIGAKDPTPVFGASLEDCVKRGIWNSNQAIWIDWEKKKMGTDLISLKEVFNSTKP